MDESIDKQKAKVIQDVTKIIGSIDSDYGTMSKFIGRLEKTGTVVNIQELDKPLNTFANVFGDDISTQSICFINSIRCWCKSKRTRRIWTCLFK